MDMDMDMAMYYCMEGSFRALAFSIHGGLLVRNSLDLTAPRDMDMDMSPAQVLSPPPRCSLFPCHFSAHTWWLTSLCSELTVSLLRFAESLEGRRLFSAPSLIVLNELTTYNIVPESQSSFSQHNRHQYGCTIAEHRCLFSPRLSPYAY